MTLRVTIGVDPGQTGALAVLVDGVPTELIDMPSMPRRAGGLQVDAASLAASVRGVRMAHPGAAFLAVIEQVGAMPKCGGTGMFRFGQADGIARGVLGALGIGYIEVPPQVWKRHLRLTGCDKDAARTLVIQRFPELALRLARKKDVGRADALLIALWAELTEAVGAEKAS